MLAANASICVSLKLVVLLSVCAGVFSGCIHQPREHIQAGVQIAFLPDIHFHDVYADFDDGAFQGLPNSISGQAATIRTLSAQLDSTRLFNENYFALLAALDDVAARGIKYVALPGDFSDDGQPVHMRGLRRILDDYAERYGIRFFAAPGNHDPQRPYTRPAGKIDYLGHGGQQQRILSRGALECADYSGRSAVVDAGFALNTICTEDVVEQGYEGIVAQLSAHGFYPSAGDVYWETPYSHYTERSYSFEKATRQAKLSYRHYEVCHQGTGGKYKQAHFDHCYQVPDVSYLVEPVKGLWLLAIDANVYVPRKLVGDTEHHANRFEGAGNAGYNKLTSHKTQVLDWIKDIVKRANAKHKTLVAFSHYPMTEFYDGASDKIADLFGSGNFQLVRKPRDDVVSALAVSGLKLHIAGHMHINDTGVYRNDTGQFLFNIQAPTLAAYVPAYKLLTFNTSQKVDVKTIVLDQVPRFNELFEHYRQEHAYLKRSNAQSIWDINILSAKNYREFTNWHISELTRRRFLPKEWPRELRDMVLSFNGEQMLVLSQLQSTVTLAQMQQSGFDFALLKKDDKQWSTAYHRAKVLASANGFDLRQFSQWNGFDLATDFYRLRNADQLALNDIPAERLRQYRLLTQALNKPIVFKQSIDAGLHSPVVQVFAQYFGALLQLFNAFQGGAPSGHFVLDLQQGSIIEVLQQ